MKVFLKIINLIFLTTIIALIAVNYALSVDANEILKNFRAEYKKAKNFTANFEQTTFVAGRKRVANGKLIYQKPNLLRQEFFDVSKPQNVTQLIVSDGKTVYSYTPLIKQVTKQVLSSKKKDTELIPGFGESLEGIEKNYDLRIIKDDLAEKQGIYLIELTPKESSTNSSIFFDVLQVWIRYQDSMPIQFMYKDNKNETTFILSFKDMKVNEKIDESVFKFKIPDDAQVITIPNR